MPKTHRPKKEGHDFEFLLKMPLISLHSKVLGKTISTWLLGSYLSKKIPFLFKILRKPVACLSYVLSISQNFDVKQYTAAWASVPWRESNIRPNYIKQNLTMNDMWPFFSDWVLWDLIRSSPTNLGGFSADGRFWCVWNFFGLGDGVGVVPDHVLPVDVSDIWRPLVAINQRHCEVVERLPAPVVVLRIALPTLNGKTWSKK